MDIAELKADLAKAEQSLENAKSTTYQFMGIVGYLKTKIAEQDKADKAAEGVT